MEIMCRTEDVNVDLSRKRQREYLKDKIDERKTKRTKHKRDSYRGINEFKNCRQSRITFVKCDNGNLHADSRSISVFIK
jgi:hypothetical protein